MTFSINTIRTTFQQVAADSPSGTKTYVNTTYKQTKVLNSAVSAIIPQTVQRNFVKILIPPLTTSVVAPVAPRTFPGVVFGAGPGPAQNINSGIVQQTATTPTAGPVVNIASASVVSGPASPDIFQIPTPEQTTTISLSSSYFGESFFSGASMFLSPFSSDLLEFSTGTALKEEEKPKILGNIIEDVRRDGFGRRNSLIIRKMKSSRGTVKFYKILRKNMFTDSDFIEIARLDPASLFLETRYNDLVAGMGETSNSAFVFTDNAIQINTIFVYKLQVEWNEGPPTREQISQTIASALAGAPTTSQNLGFINVL